MLKTLEKTGILVVLNLLDPALDYVVLDREVRPVTSADDAARGWPASSAVIRGGGAR